MVPHTDGGEDSGQEVTTASMQTHHRQFKEPSKGINQEPLLQGSGDPRPHADTTTSS